MKKALLIIFSFIVAMMLAIVPMPSWLNWLRPDWVAMVLIYWVLVLPNVVSIGMAWVIGLLLDALTGSVLGAHAYALVCVAYFVLKFQMRIHLLDLTQKAVIVFIAILLYQLVIFAINGMLGRMPATFLYWLPCLSSAIIWPWIYLVLNDSKDHFDLAVK